jgi:hypothetical protein
LAQAPGVARGGGQHYRPNPRSGGGSRSGLRRYEPAYVRAALEMVGVLAIGEVQYWVFSANNAADWGYHA